MKNNKIIQYRLIKTSPPSGQPPPPSPRFYFSKTGSVSLCRAMVSCWKWSSSNLTASRSEAPQRSVRPSLIRSPTKHQTPSHHSPCRPLRRRHLFSVPRPPLPHTLSHSLPSLRPTPQFLRRWFRSHLLSPPAWSSPVPSVALHSSEHRTAPHRTPHVHASV